MTSAKPPRPTPPQAAAIDIVDVPDAVSMTVAPVTPLPSGRSPVVVPSTSLTAKSASPTPASAPLADPLSRSPRLPTPTEVASRRPTSPGLRSVSQTAPAASSGEKFEHRATIWVPVLSVFALYAFFAGAVDVIGGVLPGVFSSAIWRFGAVGAMAPMLVKPSIGCALVTVILLLADRRRLSMVFMWTQVIAAVCTLIVIPFFVLDAIQVRAVLPDNLSGRVWVMNVGVAVCYFVAAIAVLLTCASTLRRFTREISQKEKEAVPTWG